MCDYVWDWSPFVANCQGSVQQEGGGSFEHAVVFSLVLDRTGYSLSVGGTHRAWRGCRVVTGSRPWLIQTPTRLTRWGHQIGCEDKQANISVEAITNTQQWQCDDYVTFLSYILYTCHNRHDHTQATSVLKMNLFNSLRISATLKMSLWSYMYPVDTCWSKSAKDIHVLYLSILPKCTVDGKINRAVSAQVGIYIARALFSTEFTGPTEGRRVEMKLGLKWGQLPAETKDI